MPLLKEKQRIRRGMQHRTTTARAREILAEKYGIVLDGQAGRQALWEWLTYNHRDHIHAEQFAAAYLEAIAERLEKAASLVKPQRERVIKAERKLLAQEG